MASSSDKALPEELPYETHVRVNAESIHWDQIPEQTLCICAHPKAIHTSGPYAAVMKPNMWTCSAPGGCRCPGFYDADGPMNWSMFADRLFATGVPARLNIGRLNIAWAEDSITKGPNIQARARAALLWAWKQSGLDIHEPRTWALWMHESKRVWRAWRDAGSPIVAFGKETSFGPAEIPALEDR